MYFLLFVWVLLFSFKITHIFSFDRSLILLLLKVGTKAIFHSMRDCHVTLTPAFLAEGGGYKEALCTIRLLFFYGDWYRTVVSPEINWVWRPATRCNEPNRPFQKELSCMLLESKAMFIVGDSISEKFFLVLQILLQLQRKSLMLTTNLDVQIPFLFAIAIFGSNLFATIICP